MFLSAAPTALFRNDKAVSPQEEEVSTLIAAHSAF